MLLSMNLCKFHRGLGRSHSVGKGWNGEMKMKKRWGRRGKLEEEKKKMPKVGIEPETFVHSSLVPRPSYFCCL